LWGGARVPEYRGTRGLCRTQYPPRNIPRQFGMSRVHSGLKSCCDPFCKDASGVMPEPAVACAGACNVRKRLCGPCQRAHGLAQHCCNMLQHVATRCNLAMSASSARTVWRSSFVFSCSARRRSEFCRQIACSSRSRSISRRCAPQPVHVGPHSDSARPSAMPVPCQCPCSEQPRTRTCESHSA
jgi:hypothetical protein